MTVVCRALVVALVGVAAVAGAETDPVARLTGAVTAAPWGVSVTTWQRDNPDATCERFRSTSAEGLAFEQWCWRCRRRSVPDTEWSFYAFDAPVCRLAQITTRAPAASRERGQQHVDEVVRRLAPAVGPPKTPGRFDEVIESGWGRWAYVQRLARPGLVVYVYLTGSDEPNPQVGLIARQGPLLDQLAADDRLPRTYGVWADRLRDDVNRRLRAALGAVMPPPELLAPPDQRPMPDEAAREAALARLLGEARRAPADRRAALLLAADGVARWLVPTADPKSDDELRQRRSIAGFSIEYRHDHLGGWGYGNDLVGQVWREHPRTAWGDWAFAILLEHGLDPAGGCAAEGFRDVIREARRFLAARPASAARLPVTFALAQAYETWWSLSQSSVDAYADWVAYHAGAQGARRRAIALYEEVGRLAPGSAEAREAARQLPRLRLGFDTSQRRFFCVYD